MVDFFEQQIDYIYFLYGLGFFVLSGASFILWRTRYNKVFWIWLGLFALAHGITEWLYLFQFYIGHTRLFDALITATLYLSFLFLIEFGYSGFKDIRGKTANRWILLPLVLLTGVGWLIYGQPG